MMVAIVFKKYDIYQAEVITMFLAYVQFFL